MSDAFSSVSLSGFGSADWPRNSAALPAISMLRKIAVLLSADLRRFIFIFPPNSSTYWRKEYIKLPTKAVSAGMAFSTFPIRFFPAVEYIQASRARRMAMDADF